MNAVERRTVRCITCGKVTVGPGLTHCSSCRPALRLHGFKPIKYGRMHLKCPACGRKQSNMPREDYDPPAATLAVILCPKCADACGAKDPGTDYYDAHGEPVDWSPPYE